MPDALPELLRKSLASRHLRAYALLLQFGGASVGDAQRDALQLALRQFGYLLASRRLVNDQLHESLIRALMKDGCWPLRLPHELLAFYARALLTRLAYRATSGGGAADDDDQLVVDVLRGALASLRTHAMGKDDDGGEGNDANDDDEIGSGLLPLPHCQLLALLWHSLSDGARAELSGYDAHRGLQRVARSVQPWEPDEHLDANVRLELQCASGGGVSRRRHGEGRSRAHLLANSRWIAAKRWEQAHELARPKREAEALSVDREASLPASILFVASQVAVKRIDPCLRYCFDSRAFIFESQDGPPRMRAARLGRAGRSLRG